MQSHLGPGQIVDRLQKAIRVGDAPRGVTVHDDVLLVPGQKLRRARVVNHQPLFKTEQALPRPFQCQPCGRDRANGIAELRDDGEFRFVDGEDGSIKQRHRDKRQGGDGKKSSGSFLHSFASPIVIYLFSSCRPSRFGSIGTPCGAMKSISRLPNLDVSTIIFFLPARTCSIVSRYNLVSVTFGERLKASTACLKRSASPSARLALSAVEPAAFGHPAQRR